MAVSKARGQNATDRAGPDDDVSHRTTLRGRTLAPPRWEDYPAKQGCTRRAMAGKDPLKAVRKNLKRANKAMGKERKRQQKVRDQRSAAHPSDEG